MCCAHSNRAGCTLLRCSSGLQQIGTPDSDRGREPLIQPYARYATSWYSVLHRSLAHHQFSTAVLSRAKSHLGWHAVRAFGGAKQTFGILGRAKDARESVVIRGAGSLNRAIAHSGSGVLVHGARRTAVFAHPLPSELLHVAFVQLHLFTQTFNTSCGAIQY